MTVHEPASRQLIIGIDGGTWDILAPLCQYGEMPNLARLRDHGAWSTLLSTQPPFTAPAWSTFITGLNPGQHSILSFLNKPQDPRHSLRNEGTPINSTQLRAATLWEYFNAGGKHVGSINLPLSYPLRPLDGFAVSGMLTPPDVDDWTYPPTLAASLYDYIIELDYGRPDAVSGPGRRHERGVQPPLSQILNDISRMTERRGFHTLRLMQSRPWDVLMVVFTGTDRLFHHFWHFLQPTDADAAASLDITLADSLRAYFRLLDGIIGSLVRSAGSDANVIVLSDHGFGPAARHWVHLNNWLLELDLLRLNISSGSLMQRIKHKAPWLRDIAKRILPNEAREAVKQHGHLADAIDWPHTLAWAEPLYNNVAGVTIHRADRFPDGPVSPASVDPLCAQISEQLLSLHIPGANRPLVLNIQRREEVYSGPYTTGFPDLIVTLDPDYAAVPTLGVTLITTASPLARTGDHRPDGIFVAHGPNTRPGQLASTPNLIDVAPTLLHLAGLPVPTSMEGKVIVDALVRRLPGPASTAARPQPPPTIASRRIRR